MAERVALGLGANLGDRLATLQAALDDLAVGGFAVDTVSAVYETDPVGGPEQPAYLNAVAVGSTALAPMQVLALLQQIEARHGRVRAERWGPRTLDIDVLAYGDLVSDDERLTLPHPRAAERAFVLLPWAEADPSAVLPGGRRVVDLRDELTGRERDSVRVTGWSLSIRGLS